ncbi:sigma-70 family RNA polymerase sigma factor [Mycobacterium sp. AZCC_0083]|uniref:sigma-70 family RNA polymerase sigma factor n=1 Tax=Mycobacterium sp. AZCC_0083 TaxID=2735882 RepID=UPI0016138F36|nr:sigma-70 family RNA polymerase sigma factor [Mycobacterium sp. AZCC_0083]MBB5164182.1 transcriptional regulator with XRE-family HTH domain [Mycobacterium sp. AZCC_0083]
MTTTVEEIAHKAHIRQARERLDFLDEMRDAQRLALAGKSQREIADILNTTQPRVGRILRGARALPEAETPEEIILRATIDDTPRDVLVAQLSSYPYTFTEFAPFPHDGSVPGTWTQVSAAHLVELLSDEEYESVCAAVQPPTP